MVRVGLAGSSSGAFSAIDQTIRMTVTMIAARNSMRSRYGQTCTSRAHPDLKGWTLRWCVLAIAGSASSCAIRRSLANACRMPYHV